MEIEFIKKLEAEILERLIFLGEEVCEWPDDSHKDSDWIRERGPEKIHMKNGSNIILKESEGGEKSFLSCDAHGHNIFIM